MLREQVDSLQSGWLTVALVGVSTSVLELAQTHSPSQRLSALAATGLSMAILVVAKCFVDRRWSIVPAVPRLGWWICTGLFVLPLVCEPVQRAVWNDGRSWELVLLAGLRNLGLSLAAVSRWSYASRLAGVASLFQVTAASILSDDPLVTAAAIAYGLLGCCWLMQFYRGRFGRQTLARRSTGWNIASLVALGICVALAVGLISVAPHKVIGSLPGLVPTSGGSDDRDPFARSGVNDGDDVVQALDDPHSTGATDSKMFIESPEFSLYDVAQDVFDAPPRKRRGSLEQAIGINPDDVRESQGKPAENLEASNEFSTRTRRRKQAARPRDVPTKALLYLTGSSPLHLRLMAYDEFDGVNWHKAAENHRPLPFSVSGTSNWFVSIESFELPGLAAGEPRKLSIAGLETARLPTPALLHRFRPEQVNRAGFFNWVQGGDIELAGTSRFPGGTQIDLEYQVVDPNCALQLRLAPLLAEQTCQPSDRVAALARTWTDGVSAGWPQVEAIVRHLQQRCVLDESTATTN